MLMKPCIECGELSEGARCPEHTQVKFVAPTTARGYGSAWQKLSVRARRLQPFCSDCGATDDLTADHSPEAWERHAAGLPIRLVDVDVVCRSCNSKRGRARPWGEGVAQQNIDRRARQSFPLTPRGVSR